MRKATMYNAEMFAFVLSVTGCGAVPEVIIEATKESAKESLQEVVDDLVNGIIDHSVNEWLDVPDFEFEDLADEEDSAIDDSIEDELEAPDVEDANNSGGRR